jgi:hypothetical protein
LATGAVAWVPCGATEPDTDSAADLERWFEADDPEPVPQAGHGELVFLDSYPDDAILHSRNQLTIGVDSLASGWVRLRQCYDGLDAVPDAQVVYRYKALRDLRIESHSGIGSARVAGTSVQMRDIEPGATLCVRAWIRVLYHSESGFVLRNGPFHRQFLDGYFPFHVTLDIDYPAELLQPVAVHPAAQDGFDVTQTPGKVRIDTRFAGTLYTEVYFEPKAAAAPSQ